MKFITLVCLVFSITLNTGCAKEPKKLKALIVDGQNNHTVWPQSSHMMKLYLEKTGRFDVDIYRSQFTWNSGGPASAYALSDKTYTETQQPKSDPEFSPNFGEYDVVVSNFGWRAASWPKTTQQAFESYMKNGGGLVVVHAANNSFPEWSAFNEMIGLGGWGGRNENSGPWVYFDDAGKRVDDTSPGQGGGHGHKHEFVIDIRNSEHPITKGMPKAWMQTRDELYNRLRGPAKNMTVLATAYDDKAFNGFGRHEPILMTIDYYKGRVFHSTLGHDAVAFNSVGFMSTFQRGTEWAATGEVTIPLPEQFPTADKSMVVVDIPAQQ